MKKKTMLDKLLDVLYPPVCMFCKKSLSPSDGDPVCKHCLSHLPFTKDNGCFDAFGNAAYLVSPLFYEGGVRRALHDLKFKAKFTNADILSAFMAGYLMHIPEAKAADVVVGVPLSKKSYIKRGFNQTELLADGICKRLALVQEHDILIKTRETKRQSSLRNFEARAQNVLDAFACTQALCGKTVLLVDDIYTTGMTVYNCTKALMNAGAAKVIAVTAANAHKEIGYSRHDYKASKLIFQK